MNQHLSGQVCAEGRRTVVLVDQEGKPAACSTAQSRRRMAERADQPG
jgi:hypothetical protein